MRLDLALVERGLTRSRSRAATLISDGRVLVNGTAATKASLKVIGDDVVTLVGDSSVEFASRASYKLLRTLEALADEIDVSGRRVLDVGASTGGFTDVLLRRGVNHVVALDVGHNQLVPDLRADERVTVIEGYNARELVLEDLPYAPDLVVCDVSFISIELLLASLAKVTLPEGDLLLMVKPQFEVGKHSVGTGGVVRDPSLHASAVMKILVSGFRHGLDPVAVIPSALPGPNGNREFFVWFRASAMLLREPTSELSESMRRAVDFATQLSVESDMIEQPMQFAVKKGMPESSSVANTRVYRI